jgi:hypothetical protein
MKPFSLILCVLLAAINARAEERLGNEGANGGDEVALEFKQAFASAMARAGAKSPLIHEMIVNAGLPRFLDSAVVMVTSESLVVKRDGFYQDSIAVNYPKINLIIVSRPRWKELRNEIREALALHEVAGLAGLEATGQYSISAVYLSLFSLDVDPAFDFTPVCGRLEYQILLRAEEELQSGRGTGLAIKQAALDLQLKLHSCQRITLEQFCEVVPPLENFVVSEMKAAVEKKMRGEFELLRAIWIRDANRRRCADFRGSADKEPE